MKSNGQSVGNDDPGATNSQPTFQRHSHMFCTAVHSSRLGGGEQSQATYAQSVLLYPDTGGAPNLSLSDLPLPSLLAIK